VATIRSATSRWNISSNESYHGGHGSAVSHPTSRAVAIFVWQVRHYAGTFRAEMLERIDA
jgi:hypothetical protein